MTSISDTGSGICVHTKRLRNCSREMSASSLNAIRTHQDDLVSMIFILPSIHCRLCVECEWRNWKNADWRRRSTLQKLQMTIALRWKILENALFRCIRQKRPFILFRNSLSHQKRREECWRTRNTYSMKALESSRPNSASLHSVGQHKVEWYICVYFLIAHAIHTMVWVNLWIYLLYFIFGAAFLRFDFFH